MKNVKNSTKGILSLVLLTAVFGSFGVFGRYFNANFPLFMQVFLRIFLAFLLCLVFFKKDLHFEKIKKISLREWSLLIIRSFTQYISGVVLFTLAILNTKLGNVSVIESLPFVAFFGFIFLREKISSKKIILILLAFIGVVIMSFSNGHFSAINKGDILALVSSISLAIGYITRRWHADLLNNKEITTLMLFISSVFLLIGSFIFRETFSFSSFTFTIDVVLLIAGFLNVFGLLLINYGFQHVEGSLASNLLTLEAVFGTLFGFMLYGEIPTFFEIIGSLLIIGSVILLNRLEAKNS